MDDVDEQERTPLVSEERVVYTPKIYAFYTVNYLILWLQMYAALADQVEVVQLLISKGALITAQDANGQTPMHFAALQVTGLGV